jgi:putative transposase
MARKRKHHTAAFEAQVALAAVKAGRTANEVAAQYGVHPTLIHVWKKQLLAGAVLVFANGVRVEGVADAQAKKAELFEQIGRLPEQTELSVRRQCVLLGLSRSTLNYQPAAETQENLALMRRIDEQYTAPPYYGSRRMTVWLVPRGKEVNRKRVHRLMRVMGESILGVVVVAENTATDAPDHRTMPLHQNRKSLLFSAAEIAFQQLSIRQFRLCVQQRRITKLLNDVTDRSGPCSLPAR